MCSTLRLELTWYMVVAWLFANTVCNEIAVGSTRTTFHLMHNKISMNIIIGSSGK